MPHRPLFSLALILAASAGSATATEREPGALPPVGAVDWPRPGGLAPGRPDSGWAGGLGLEDGMFAPGAGALAGFTTRTGPPARTGLLASAHRHPPTALPEAESVRPVPADLFRHPPVLPGPPEWMGPDSDAPDDPLSARPAAR
ncbi:hypothetical protein [Oleisolibacter albus]|uniref:hypothetical protein n=1 Tax=Oleisolibacter albus TaxID=2171757 RepID=UPI000DF440E4|nr:hypothetical protein [Oleisolibacter albus]